MADKERAVRLDRNTWAEYDRATYDVGVRGVGEYLSEPIYFGRAFSAQPTLTYSSVFGDQGVGVVPNVIVEAKGGDETLDSNSLSNSSHGRNAIIPDPSFEVQGQFVGRLGDTARRIPTVHDIGDEQVISDNWVWSPDGGDYREPEDANFWVQTAYTKDRWTLSDSKSNDFGFGREGKWSAKYVFSTSGSSNWLIPFEWANDIPDNRKDDEWMYFSVRGYPTVSGYANAVPPPHLNGWNGTASVWSDDDCELEIYAYNWHDYGKAGDPDKTLWDDHSYRYMSEVTRTYPVSSNKWNKVDFDLPMANGRAWPNFPVDVSAQYGSLGWMYWTFRARINGGSVGQIVHFDDFYAWPNLVGGIPLITIGVAEWIIDDYDAYIGARVWYKVGYPS